MLKEELENVKNENLSTNKNEKLDLKKKCSVYESTFEKLVEVIYAEERKRGFKLFIIDTFKIFLEI